MKCNITGHIVADSFEIETGKENWRIFFKVICIPKYYNGTPKPPIYATIRTLPINTKEEAEQQLLQLKAKTKRVEIEGIYPNVDENGFHYQLSKITDCELDREGLLHLFEGTITGIDTASGENKAKPGFWYRATFKVLETTKSGSTWTNYASKLYNDSFARDNHIRHYETGDVVKVEATPNSYKSKDIWRMSYNIEKIDIIKKAEPVAAPEQTAVQPEPEQVFEQADGLPF